MAKKKGSKNARGAGRAPQAKTPDSGDEFTLAAQQMPEDAGIGKPRAGKPKATAPAGRKGDHPEVLSYRHADKRKNNPEVGMVKPENDPDDHNERWCYDPHIDPALQFDFGRAQVEKLIDEALSSGNQNTMRAALEELKRYSAPYLNWTGKAERTTFDVDTVSLHVHERIDPASILAAVRKKLKEAKSNGEFMQPDLFAAPFENLPLRDAIDFYKHERGWANRLIAGDSLLVMNSLLQKESMAGQVQMIYIDPPYGIKYGSNFQPFVNKRDVKDRKDEDLTQEPEMIKAFRDTWELGIHSYLTYLRDRLLLAKELLHESGSVFVQISDENLHLVRGLLDEIFGAGNFVALITFRKTSITFATQRLGGVSDYVIWYAKDMSKYKYHTLYKEKQVGGEGASNYGFIEFSNGSYRRIGKDEEHLLAQGNRLFSSENLMSGGATPSCMFDFVYQEKAYSPVRGKSWKTNLEGMKRLSMTNRLVPIGDQRLYFKTYFDEYAITKLTNLWADTRGEMDLQYIVQTTETIVERCMLMTTDPGDLVLDPTCGSGTTAVVAEKWGRRWITCDTSRVSVTLAKQRLMTASYDYYELKYPQEGLKSGFIYKTVPHVTLGSIANNPEIDDIYARMHPAVEAALVELNAALHEPSPPAPLPPAGEGSTSPSPAGGRRDGDEGVEVGYIPHPPAKLPDDLLRHAREMRSGATDAENLLWQLLRNRRLADAKFRRQHPIGKYIADFYCDEHRLVIELDGGQHAEQVSYDEQRTAYLKKQGLTVLRFWNNQVLSETESVLQVIWDYVANSDTLTPSPSPASGRGEKDALTPTPLPLAGEGLKEWEVPFDFPTDWPEAARKPFDAFHAARQAMQKKMDDSIAAHADQETLYDQPAVSKNKLRITGPFTVEAVPFPTVLALDEAEQPQEADVAIARSGESARQHSWRDELLKTGIRGKGGQMLKFADLETLPDSPHLHVSGHLDSGERVVVSFGPEHAALEQRQVTLALNEAEKLRPAPKFIIFASFEFDPEAAKDIDETKWPGVTLLKAKMNADLLTDDLKKGRASNQSFWLMGQPDVEVHKQKDGRYVVEVHGFDYFDTAKGELVSGGKGKIAMWLLDTDYDERSLFPRQVFFPMAGKGEGWEKLKKDIRAELNDGLLEKFHGTKSLPFEAGENKKVAVKIVDDRGIESLKILPLG